MGFSISIYSRQTKENYKKSTLDFNQFIQNSENLVNFTDEESKLLEDHLKTRGYIFKRIGKAIGNLIPECKVYAFDDDFIPIEEVSLSKTALHFYCPFGEGVMEVSMTAGELDIDNQWSKFNGHFSVLGEGYEW